MGQNALSSANNDFQKQFRRPPNFYGLTNDGELTEIWLKTGKTFDILGKGKDSRAAKLDALNVALRLARSL